MLLVTDKELLRRFRRGDPDATARVFDHYCQGVASYLQRGFSFGSKGAVFRFRGFSSRHDLHDALAETFRRAFEERARLGYSGMGPYSAYLQRIARNLVLDQLRSPASRLRHLDEELDGAASEAAGTPTPERQLQRAELQQIMRAFLAGLSSEERSFVELRFQRGLAQRDVAQQLDRSRRYVRSMEGAIRKKLLRHLDKTGYGGPAAAGVFR